MATIQFTCPGCRVSHDVDAAAAGRRGRCATCGVALRVPTARNAVAEALAPAGPRPGRPAAKPVILAPERLSGDGADDVLEAPSDPSSPSPLPASAPLGMEPAVERPEPPKKAKTSKKTRSAADDEEAPDAPERIELTEDGEVPEEAESAEPDESGARRKQRLAIGGILALALGVGAYVYLGTVGEDAPKSKPVAKASDETRVPDAAQGPVAETPPAKKDPLPVPEGGAGKKDVSGPGAKIEPLGPTVPKIAGPTGSKKTDQDGKNPKADDKSPKANPVALPTEVAVAPPPRVSVNEPLPYTLAAFHLEYADDPAAFEERFRRQRFLLRAVVVSAAGDRLVLGDLAPATRAQQKRPAVECQLPQKLEGLTQPVWPKLLAGQPVAVRGTFLGLTAAGEDERPRLRFGDCELVATAAPADAVYGGKDVEVTGVVRRLVADSTNPDSNKKTDRVVGLVLEPPTTDSPVTVQCLFRNLDQDPLTKLRPGAAVTVRGTCGDRSFGVVTLHNCVVVTPQTPPPAAQPLRLPAHALFAAYEADLLPGERPALDAPVLAVGSSYLAEKFATDPKQAAAMYRFKPVEVTGRIVERNPEACTLVLETGTNHPLRLAVVFTPRQFARLPAAETRLLDQAFTARGVCAGVGPDPAKKRGPAEVEETLAVRVENAAWYRGGQGDAATETVAGFLPLKLDRELTYDMLKPGQPRENLVRLSVRSVAPDRIVWTPARVGLWPSATLFGDKPLAPKWIDAPKAKLTPLAVQYRVADGFIESREIPAPPLQPSDWWEPTLKLGAFQGESWSAERPDGAVFTYTVEGFDTDTEKRPIVEVRRTIKHPKDPRGWEETRLVYTLGVGETRRLVVNRLATGQAVTATEVRLVESPPGPKDKEPAKKDPGSPPTTSAPQ